ncbi:MAG: hydrogenase maturation nickel metallochaperone HypA [Promethearchaeota archaeon]
MHEFSLAQSVLETVLAIAEERQVKRIKKIILKFGTFALVQEDQFRFCFNLIKADSELVATSELEVIWTPGELHCDRCGFEGKIKDSPQEHYNLGSLFQCPVCNSYSTNIISGTETIIDSILV